MINNADNYRPPGRDRDTLAEIPEQLLRVIFLRCCHFLPGAICICFKLIRLYLEIIHFIHAGDVIVQRMSELSMKFLLHAQVFYSTVLINSVLWDGGNCCELCYC
jgi:hypothetical protein